MRCTYRSGKKSVSFSDLEEKKSPGKKKLICNVSRSVMADMD